MVWKSININVQNAEKTTDKAVLIKMPHKSNYDGYMFWHPSKLVRSGRHSWSVSLSYTDDFKFKLRKYNKRLVVIDEIEISAKEFEKEFGIIDENIFTIKKDNKSYLIVEEPKPLNIEKVDVPDILKNN